MNMMPNFPSDIAVPVQNYLSGERYILRRIDELEVSPSLVQGVTTICNEPSVYKWIFEDLFGSTPYTKDKAESFFEIGLNGWKEKKHFIFLLMSQTGDVVAAIDIKSPDLENAEIGYWASELHRGCMTNTVLALLSLARTAGYFRLFGRVKKENIASMKVLSRAGFQNDTVKSESCDTHNYYQVFLKTMGE
ncbi:GNAT family N-acetyltransferase [Marinomonas sp. C2222]|uniref:GNAT family N-acetyltransferase n=1 Tax=Marinomonas sargassi TaxID=2984494 RepID=A0ABT2YRJ4_9GAMM|nr:GNAT family N-acetyltransferase [Marinomonas sargassi]MCV2402510.1 GNAT family N-acetyltransferase [Marinomonas sargassi]